MSRNEPDRISRTELLELVVEAHRGPRRGLIGLTGPPGSGKSHLAAGLSAWLRPPAPVVPLDGFHLPQAVIDAKGLADRKGSPDTFDPQSYLKLLTEIARPAGRGVLLAPRFDRSIEEPVPDAIRVTPADRLVITEGNYLLLDESPWAQIWPVLDLCAYLETDDETRVSRLVERHVRYGKPRLEAERFVRESDEKNAELIKGTRDQADFIVRMDP